MTPMTTLNSNENRSITARPVPNGERTQVLPRHFGRRMIRFEAAVYDWLGSLSKDYSGAYWNFYELSNGGFYMAPVLNRLLIESPNGFSRTVSPDAAGIIACLFSCSHLSFHSEDEVFANHFHLLRPFALEHSEANLILAAID